MSVKNLLLISSSLVSFVFSQTVFSKIDKTRLFISTEQIQLIEKNPHITNIKHLFNEHYVVTTQNSLELEEDLDNLNIKFQRNTIAKKKKLTVEDPELLPTIKNNENIFVFNDPLVDRVWSFANTEGNGVSVNDHYISPLRREKVETIVAVVDTGVDYEHDDLKDIMWVNHREIPDNNIDDDDNGHIDDVYGINTLHRDEVGNMLPAGKPTHSHGTHVAGTIAATQNNNLGIAGIASKTKIISIRAVPDEGDETDVDIVESFLYAAKNGAKIINCSFGKEVNEGGSIVNETINYIGKEYGTVVFASAGNDYGRDIDFEFKYPASFDSEYLIVIASTTIRGRLSFFSNIGMKNVDLAAPGSRIYSTVLDQEYSYMSGTSMAAPTAAGVAAELWSNFPELTPQQLKEILIKSSVPVPDFKGKLQAEGRVDLVAAIKYTLENYIDL